MKLSIGGFNAALVSMLIAGTAIATSEPVFAQGAADRLMGARSVLELRGDERPSRYYRRDRRENVYRQRPRDYERRGGFYSLFGRGPADDYYAEPQQPPQPVVRVSSPKYHTYQADQLKTVTLAGLAREIAEARHQAEEKARAEAAAASAAVARTPQADVVSDETTGSVAAMPSAPSAFERAADTLGGVEIRALPQVIEAVRAHYAANPAYLWVEDGAVSAKAEVAMAVMAKADEVGLDPADYSVDLPQGPVAMGESSVVLAAAEPSDINSAVDAAPTMPLSEAQARPSAAELMRFEMHLSAAALTYALDAVRGRVAADRISGYHDLPRHEVDLEVTLASLAASDDVAGYLEARNPSSPQFEALVATLADLRAEEEGDVIVIAPGTLIKPGGSDAELANVIAAIRKSASAELLEKHADTLAIFDGTTPDYTPGLVALVRDFQREKGLSVDGVIGPNTIRAMVGVTVGDKIEKVKLAMERLRWLPRDLGDRRVFINQPAFTATYVEPGRDPLSMRVVVGTKANQTNFFYDTIETVEYNPYWGVPYSIIVNEMVPKLYQDPSYLDRSGYEVTTPNGRKVSSASVDWGAVARKQQSINVRQYPGRSNALGQLKILFPNKHDIYMHDTPQKHLFSRDTRAYSHGCVRLQDPRAMAAAVLGTTVDHVDERIARGNNNSEEVGGKIPVYVAYFTAWPDEGGKVGFYADIYDRDMYLRRALDATRDARRG